MLFNVSIASPLDRIKIIMKVCLSYANWWMKSVQKFNSDKTRRSGFFDKVICASPRDLDKEFRLKHKNLLRYYHRGGGYWVWKPYIIRKVLATLKKEDFLFYVDADHYVTEAIEPLIKLMLKWNQDLLPFEGVLPNSKEICWNKRDLLLAMDCDRPEFFNTPNIRAASSLWKGDSSFALKFLDEWMSYAENEHFLTDIPSKTLNYPEFLEHRHDQSIYSLLVKKHGLKTLPFIRPSTGLPYCLSPSTPSTWVRSPNVLSLRPTKPSLQNLRYWLEYLVLECLLRVLMRLGLRRDRKEN